MACDFGCSVLLDSILTNLLAAQRRAQFDAAAAVSANEIAQRAVLEPIIVNRIIVDAFVACDNEILRRELEKMQESKRRLLPHVPSMPGSCAIVTVVMDGFIYVANLGYVYVLFGMYLAYI